MARLNNLRGALEEDNDLPNLNVAAVPPPDVMAASQESDLLAPFYRPEDEAGLPPESLRLTLDEDQRLPPFFRRDPIPESLRRPAEVAPRPVARAAAVAKAPAPAAPEVKVPEASPIPTRSASVRVDTPVAVTTSQPPVTADRPAGPADSAGTSNLPPPSSTPPGSGGDDELSSLRKQLGLQQMFEALGSAGSGKNLYTDGGVLADRMKQLEALRAKREEKALGDVEERSNLNAAIDSYKQLFPDQADALERLRGSTNKPAVLREQLNAWRQMMEWEKAKKPVAEARVEQMGAGTDLTRAKIPEVGLEGESKRLAREQAAALGWARLSAQSAEAAARAAADVAKSGASAIEQRAVDEQLGRIEKIIKGAGYTPLIASLEQADQAIASLGAPPSSSAQMKHALPGGDRFLSPQEKAYFNSVDKLKQMEQLAISGKVVSVQEREEFIKEYGTNWYANPTAAAAYIDMLRKKTARQIDLDLASVRASPTGQLAIDAYTKAGGITSALPVFKGATAPAPVTERPAKPTTFPAGKAVLWSLAEGKWKAVPAENADAAVASGKYER